MEGWNEGWSRVHVVFTEATLAGKNSIMKMASKTVTSVSQIHTISNCMREETGNRRRQIETEMW